MAGEIEQIPRLPRLKGDGPRGKAVHQPGVPVEGHPAEEPGHEGQPRAVHAQGGLTAPAVLGALVGQGPPPPPGPAGPPRTRRVAFCNHPPRDYTLYSPPGRPREGLFSASPPRPPPTGRPAPPGAGCPAPGLSTSGRASTSANGARTSRLFRPVQSPAGRRCSRPGPALVAVFGADAAPAGGEFLQKLGGPAAQQLVGALRAGAGGGIEGAQGGRDYNFHEKTSQSVQFCAMLKKYGLLD